MAAAAAGAFALTPADAVPGVIDYTTPEGRNIYKYGTSRLTEGLFDCHADGLHTFLNAVDARGKEYGWSDDVTGILYIPTDPAAPFDLHYLVERYGTITLQQIRNFDETYINLPVRAAQDNQMLFKALFESLSKEGRDKVTLWKEEYHVGNKPSGLLLLKVIIRESHVDTNATSASIRLKLMGLDNQMAVMGFNITKFNEYVMLLVQSLAARGERSDDLLINLFKGYLAAPDKEFKSYVRTKQNEYFEGAEIRATTLMRLAKDKYEMLVESKAWNAPTTEEEKIIALEAKVKTLEKGTNKTKPGPKQPPKGGVKPGKEERKRKPKPNHLKKAPKPGDHTKTIDWNGMKWHWCGKLTGGTCEKWRCHRGKDCKGTGKKPPPPKPETKPEEEAKLKLANALAAIQSDDSDDQWE